MSGNSSQQHDVVVITGASSGIGRPTAHRFAHKGARLVLAARNEAELEEVEAECIQHGAEAVAVPTDVTVEYQVQDLVNAAINTFGQIDVWVGNAAAFSYGTFEQTPPEVFRQLVETNLMGQISGARAVLPHFREQGHGTLILVGSLYGQITTPYVSPYVTAKFGLLGFTRVLRQELRSEPDINVCTVLPSTIDTPLYQHAANYVLQHVHPLPPLAGPQRVARAIVRLPEHPRGEIAVGRLQRSFIPFQRLAPGLYDRAIGPIMNKAALRGGSIPGSTGNVFGRTQEPNGATGGWRFPRDLVWVAALPAAAVVARLLTRVTGKK